MSYDSYVPICIHSYAKAVSDDLNLCIGKTLELATKNIGLDAAVAVSHKSPAHAADLRDAEAVERHPANIL